MMKKEWIIIAVLVGLLLVGAAKQKSEVGRYQIINGESLFRAEPIIQPVVYRIDTVTGKSWFATPKQPLEYTWYSMKEEVIVKAGYEDDGPINNSSSPQ